MIIGHDWVRGDKFASCASISNRTAFVGAPWHMNTGSVYEITVPADADDDSIADECDNCPAVWNPDQADADSDGLGDACDNCPNSDLSATIVIDGCDSGVDNQMLGDSGCTMADRIAECAAGATSHGQFVSCVAQLTNEWKREGLITGQEKGRIQRCAATADIPAGWRSRSQVGLPRLLSRGAWFPL
jgi:hypothetical protein